MLICPNCFSDKELKAFINSSPSKGDCKVCDGKNQPQIELTELIGYFQELIDNFEYITEGVPIKNKIQGGWSFFSSHSVAEKILNKVLPQLSTDILNSNSTVDYSKEIVDNYSYWSILKEEIKTKNRFIINIEYLTEELSWDRYFNTQYQLNKSTTLFRARVHHESGEPAYDVTKMSCPPANKTSSGRANPLGIPVLYLSDNPETVLYETRASYLDEISVGEFTLVDNLESIRIVDFTEDTNLFQPGYVNETIKSRLLRDTISRDLSKPMRRYDTELEYIPTQFICEFIRVITGSDGIRFNSSLHPEGKNFVIFDQFTMVCEKVILKKINSLSLTAIELEKD